MATLRRRELLRLARQLRDELGLGFSETREHGEFSGVYRKAVDASGGRYAVIAKSREFTLVPWRRDLERQLGREISGRRIADGISWTIGREREGPEIGM